MATAEKAAVLESLGGAFVSSLTRNNKEIKRDRAIQIAEDTEITYKRRIEDMEQEIKKLKRDRESMLDLSPTNADSLMIASDFKAKEFIEKDLKIGITIRNLEIALEIAKERYNYLFKK
jgi:hypothetical protein